jgi:cytochrome c
MRMKLKTLIGAGLMCGAALAGVAHAGDAKRGANVFEEQCAECHSLKPGKAKKGPSLFGLLGRGAASQADYAYSDAMKSSALTWTPTSLDAYLIYPRKYVPGTKMKYDGLASVSDRADLIQYLGGVN